MRLQRDSAYKILSTYYPLSSVNAANINDDNKNNNIINCGNRKLVLKFLHARDGYELDRRDGSFATGFSRQGSKEGLVEGGSLGSLQFSINCLSRKGSCRSWSLSPWRQKAREEKGLALGRTVAGEQNPDVLIFPELMTEV